MTSESKPVEGTTETQQPAVADRGGPARAAEATADAHSDRRIANPARPLAESNRYTAHREVGRGGMGVVTEAHDALLGRRVAIKRLIRPDDAVERRRFETEAMVTAQLDHAGMPTLFEYCPAPADGGPPFYTMRLVEGQTLGQRLQASRTLEDRLALLPVVQRVAQTLAHAHQRGIVHRDVKPENIVVGPHGEVVLLDWGIAKIQGGEALAGSVRAKSPDGLTSHGDVLGTPAYMAPEQARGDLDAIDARTDVFGLGAILFYVLSGHPPMDRGQRTAELAQAADGTRPDIDQAAPQASAELRGLVRWAMAVDPAARPTDAGVFAQALADILTRAVARTPTRGIEGLISLTGAAGLIVAIALFVAAWLSVPGIRQMGHPALASLIFGGVAILLGGIEWWTRGRHHLAALGAALAGLTMVSAFSGAIVAMVRVHVGLARPEVVADAEQYRYHSANGYAEAMGNVPFGATLAMIAWIILALAWRRTRIRALEE